MPDGRTGRGCDGNEPGGPGGGHGVCVPLSPAGCYLTVGLAVISLAFCLVLAAALVVCLGLVRYVVGLELMRYVVDLELMRQYHSRARDNGC